MSVQPAVRIASGKFSTLAYLFCILLSGASPILATRSPTLHSDQIRLTPKIDLHLEPTPVEGLPDRTLNLPPGFKVKLFSDQVDKARFMAWDDHGVLHVANMKPRRGNTWHPVPGRQSTVLALPDKDGDGRADTVYKAADDLNWAHSIAFYQKARSSSPTTMPSTVSKTKTRTAFTRSAPSSPRSPALWILPMST